MGRNNTKLNSSHLLWGIAGLAVGVIWSRSELESSKKSRAEVDDPDGAKEVCEGVAFLLEAWESAKDCETEDHFTEDLADFLENNSKWEIEVSPDSPKGQPDILIGDLLALELKVNPSKSERDRLIGQCAGYSRLWVTWAVIIGAPESRVGRLVDLLEDKGLEQIAVWSF